MLKRKDPRPGRAVRQALPYGLVFLGLLIIAHSSAFPAWGVSHPAPAQELRVIDLTGTPYEMGKIHGQTLKPEILELVKRWKADLEKTYQVPAEDFVRNLLKKTDFRPAIDRWTPGLLDEVRGIADGVGVDFNTIYAYQLVDEIWAMDADLGLSKCTSIAAGKRDGNPAFVAQTLDIPAFYHGFQTVLRIRDKRENLETLVFTIPGVVAANGLNSRSVGVCVNAVTQLAYSPAGLPVAFVIRGILRQTSYEQAVTFLRDIQPAAPQNYVIGGPAEAASFERSAGMMSGFFPFEGAEFTYHTNHPLINDDLNPRFPEALKRAGTTLEQYRALCPRFNFLGQALKDNAAAIDLDILKALFRNRASGINNAGTYGCTIMVLGANPELHISPGRPDEEPFQVLTFSPRAVPASAGVPDKDKTRANDKGEKVEVTVTAPRVEIPLKQNPAATTVVGAAILETMPRTIAIDEVMKLVPGVRVDNQADGERVHLSVRGQGILTERGTRGVRAILDGIPLNDPSGFVADFYDVDWATVRRIEVMRGPAAAFYGSGSSGGIINILTRDGGPEPVSGSAFLTRGMYGLKKGLGEVDGTTGIMNYRISGSMLTGDGYRDQQKYNADNAYGKFKFDLGPSVKVTAVLGYTDYFNQNAEGLNLNWFSADPGRLRRKANPDAYKFNEYQQTRRFTSGVTGHVALASDLDLAMTAFFRHTKYTEAVPSSLIHRAYDTPGVSLQVNHRTGEGRFKNHLSAGVDLGWQTIDEFRRPNFGNAVEGPTLLSDQKMSQTSAGVFVLERVELGPQWGASLSLRYDNVTCKLDDRLGVFSGDADYKKATGRLGLTWNPMSDFGLYASWGSGFLPPGTEELASNPGAFGGFNKDLKPATSSGEEIGARGSIGGSFVYDLALFHLSTDRDFGRYRIASRPLETFYGNVGSTKRFGLETSLAWYPVEPLALRLAYTYSRFKYVTVRTLDAAAVYKATWLPNSPAHQLYLDGEYKITPRLTAGAALEYVSSCYIDATNRTFANGYGRTDPYALVHVRLGYSFEIDGMPLELLFSGRNILGVKYYGFTEPDPDGNSYQPAPTAEWTASLRFGLGKPRP